MIPSNISAKLFETVKDRLRNYNSKIELAEGLIWNYLTEGQYRFMLDESTTQIDYNIYLFNGVQFYMLPEWILSINEIELRDSSDKPISSRVCWSSTSTTYQWFVYNFVTVELPRITTIANRNMRVDPNQKLQDGWRLRCQAILRPIPDVDIIDKYHSPIIEHDYHNLLIDWALSYYRVKMIDNKQVVNPDFKGKEEVIKEVRMTRDKLYGLDRVSLIKPHGWSK